MHFVNCQNYNKYSVCDLNHTCNFVFAIAKAVDLAHFKNKSFISYLHFFPKKKKKETRYKNECVLSLHIQKVKNCAIVLHFAYLLALF